MKYNITSSSNEPLIFSDCSEGDLFHYGKHMYIKISTLLYKEEDESPLLTSVNAIRLKDGEPVCIPYEAVVSIYNDVVRFEKSSFQVTKGGNYGL